MNKAKKTSKPRSVKVNPNRVFASDIDRGIFRPKQVRKPQTVDPLNPPFTVYYCPYDNKEGIDIEGYPICSSRENAWAFVRYAGRVKYFHIRIDGRSQPYSLGENRDSESPRFVPTSEKAFNLYLTYLKNGNEELRRQADRERH